MAVFEETPTKDDYLDDTARLFCTITNSRIIDGHTVSINPIKIKLYMKYINKQNNYLLYTAGIYSQSSARLQ